MFAWKLPYLTEKATISGKVWRKKILNDFWEDSSSFLFLFSLSKQNCQVTRWQTRVIAKHSHLKQKTCDKWQNFHKYNKHLILQFEAFVTESCYRAVCHFCLPANLPSELELRWFPPTTIRYLNLVILFLLLYLHERFCIYLQFLEFQFFFIYPNF